MLLIDLDLDTTFTRIETRTVKKHYNALRNWCGLQLLWSDRHRSMERYKRQSRTADFVPVAQFTAVADEDKIKQRGGPWRIRWKYMTIFIFICLPTLVKTWLHPINRKSWRLALSSDEISLTLDIWFVRYASGHTDRQTDKHADDIIFLLAEQRSVLYTHVHFTARCILSFTKDDPGSYELSDRPADQSLFNNHIACAARLTDKLAVCTWTTSASDSDQLAMLVPSITRFSCIVARCSQAVSVSQGRTLDFLLGVAIDNNACNNLHYTTEYRHPCKYGITSSSTMQQCNCTQKTSSQKFQNIQNFCAPRVWMGDTPLQCPEMLHPLPVACRWPQQLLLLANSWKSRQQWWNYIW